MQGPQQNVEEVNVFFPEEVIFYISILITIRK